MPLGITSTQKNEQDEQIKHQIDVSIDTTFTTETDMTKEANEIKQIIKGIYTKHNKNKNKIKETEGTIIKKNNMDYTQQCGRRTTNRRNRYKQNKNYERTRGDKQTKKNKKVEQNKKMEKGNKLANNINYGDIWDSTKGYPGEGPAQTNGRMGKKNAPSKDRGDKKWQSCIDHWKEESKPTDKIMSDIHTIGDDLWYNTQQPVTWDKMIGTVASLNMAGWGAQEDRDPLWEMLKNSRTLIIALIDTKITDTGITNLETELRERWIAIDNYRPHVTHAPAKNRHIGGIVLALHPCLARYASINKLTLDPRGWGRWTGTTLIGRKRKIAIIATYGPTPNTNDKAIDSMWQYQIKQMDKIPPAEKENDPRYQYIADLEKTIHKSDKK